MREYPKIQSIYKRDLEKTSKTFNKFLEGQWSLPEFEYLANNQWEWTEKIDGTNIRVIWFPKGTGEGYEPLSQGHYVNDAVLFRGKTDNADIPKFLFAKLQEMFPAEKIREIFPDTPLCLYGEGYGAKIQKGHTYIPNGVSFILFDVWIKGWWLKRLDVQDAATKLGIDVVPIKDYCTIPEAIELYVRNGFKSKWGDFLAEGLVGKPIVELKDRRGDRILTKLKTKDFNKEIKLAGGKCSLWDKCENACTITCYEARTTDCFIELKYEKK